MTSPALVSIRELWLWIFFLLLMSFKHWQTSTPIRWIMKWDYGQRGSLYHLILWQHPVADSFACSARMSQSFKQIIVHERRDDEKRTEIELPNAILINSRRNSPFFFSLLLRLALILTTVATSELTNKLLFFSFSSPFHTIRTHLFHNTLHLVSVDTQTNAPCHCHCRRALILLSMWRTHLFSLSH